MKQVKLSLMVIALTAGIFGAFAFRSHPQKVTSMDTLVWFQTISDTNPAPNTSSTPYSSSAAAAAALGCQAGTSYYCAAQYDETLSQATGLTIKKSNP
jgi:hypothetical protein